MWPFKRKKTALEALKEEILDDVNNRMEIQYCELRKDYVEIVDRLTKFLGIKQFEKTQQDSRVFTDRGTLDTIFTSLKTLEYRLKRLEGQLPPIKKETRMPPPKKPIRRKLKNVNH